MIETSGPLDGDATVSYAASASVPVRCAGGQAGVQMVEASGDTSGSLAVARNLSGATLEATVPVETVRTTLCGDDVSTTAHSATTRMWFALSGVGSRWTETSGSYVKVPSAETSMEHARSIGRDAAGSFHVGPTEHPLVFGDFGRITGVWHLRNANVGMRLLVPPDALRALVRTSTGRMQRASALWEHASGTGYQGLLVGADHTVGGETLVYATGYVARTITCADGSRALLEVIRDGEGPGRLDVSGHHAAARASGQVRMITTSQNGCTGQTSTTVSQIGVSLELHATGDERHSGEWVALHNPPGGPRRVSTRWSARAAAGLVRAGQITHDGTGMIGTLSWRERQ